MCITFVTSLIHIYDQDYDTIKTINWRIERFREIADTGIHIYLYISNEFINLVPREYSNVRIMAPLKPICDEENPTILLPQQRNIKKDTAKYMYVVNSKTDLMTDAIQRNEWKSTHFAWIDFNISHVFSQKEQTLRFLRELDTYNLPEKCMLVPGCWTKYNNINVGHVTECVNWRFCGGFFIGDKDSILHFGELYTVMLSKFIEEYKRLVWEVNFWAWLEVNSDWNPQWYLADHNDSIITNLPCATIATVLKPHSIETQYDYPTFPLFYPSSASYLKFGGEHLLNTRYVNYWYYENGTYLFKDELNIIRNKNVFSRLVEENGVLMPLDYHTMNDETIHLPSYDMYSRGIEDVRLYEHNGRVRFIATTVGYHTTGGNRMLIGNYDYKTMSYSDVQLIGSPTNSYCEKNWVPIPSSDGEERFIYKWNPYTIITVNKGSVVNYNLNKNDMILPVFFNRMKGSSAFIEHKGELIGVTHFSEDAMPRRYFHMLVVLDKNTYVPIRYSKPFVFEKVGIEFCIGFDATGDKYRFWISRFDRDPILLEVDMHIISFVNVYDDQTEKVKKEK